MLSEAPPTPYFWVVVMYVVSLVPPLVLVPSEVVDSAKAFSKSSIGVVPVWLP